MNLLNKIWQAIKAFFSPTKEEWADFYRKKQGGDAGYGAGGGDHGGDCGDGGGGDGGGGD